MTEILDQEHMAPPRSHSQTLDAAASIQARALREGRPWRCGKLGDKTDNARCISRRIQAHKHGKQHAPCHDCTIPAMIQNQKLPLRDTPAAAPVPVVENKENNPMSKRGTCIDCKRPDMSIIVIDRPNGATHVRP